MNSNIKQIIISSVIFTAGCLFFSCADTLSDTQRETFVKFYGSYQADNGNDVFALVGGGFAITGSSTPDSVSQMILIRTDEYGNQEEGSPTYYGDGYQTQGNVLLELSDGFLIGGMLSDTIDGVELQTDAFLVRTDNTGSVIWTQRYGGDENDAILYLTERSSGGFMIAGRRSTGEQEDVWIFTVDDNGDMLNEFVGNDTDDDDEANFLLNTKTGYLAACTYDDIMYEGTDIYVVYLNDECGVENSITFGTNDDDIARSIVRDGNGYIVTGYSENTTTGHSEIRAYRFNLDGNQLSRGEDIEPLAMAGADLYTESCVVNADGDIVVAGTIDQNEDLNMMLAYMLTSGGTPQSIIEFGELGTQMAKSIKNTPGGGLVMVGSNGLEGNRVISLVKVTSGGKLN